MVGLATTLNQLHNFTSNFNGASAPHRGHNMETETKKVLLKVYGIDMSVNDLLDAEMSLHSILRMYEQLGDDAESLRTYISVVANRFEVE